MSTMLSEYLSVDDQGHLRVEELDCLELADRFGTPLYVTSENQIRHNYRRLYRAFAECYPRVTILYANKANGNFAVRRILTQEGAGGDCFGLGELTLSLLCGTAPEKLVMNGSNKSPEEVRAAIEVGATINVDHPEELELVEQVAAALGRDATIHLRVLPFSYADLDTLDDDQASIARDRSHDKWGMDRETIREVAPRALALPHVRLQGLHCHVSRLRPTPEHFALAARLMAECIADLRNRLGWEPRTLDMGGGFAHERDPESGRPPGDHRVATPEEFAEALVGPLRTELARRGLREPHLFLEPGRRLVSNSTVLLGRVGIVKRLPSATVAWVNVDMSDNHCLRTAIAGYYYQIVNVARVDAPPEMVANVTGPTCTLDLVGKERPLPRTERGDVLAVLDVGGYAEVLATQFNALPRPATVLVNGRQAEVIRRRETLQDVFATQQVPPRLLAGLPAQQPLPAAAPAS